MCLVLFSTPPGRQGPGYIWCGWMAPIVGSGHQRRIPHEQGHVQSPCGRFEGGLLGVPFAEAPLGMGTSGLGCSRSHPTDALM